MIAFGIAGFGYEPFGWRVGVAVAGTLSVGVVYLLAWRLLRGFVVSARGVTVGAIAASGLLATDFLHLVHSRVGMLDAFIVLFATAAVLFIVLDRDRVRDRPDAPWWWRASPRPSVAAARRRRASGRRPARSGRARTWRRPSSAS